MVTLHEVITFLVSMQISIAACRPIMSIDVVEVVIWRESSVSGGSGDRKSGSAGMPRPISYAVFCLKKKKTMTTYNCICTTWIEDDRVPLSTSVTNRLAGDI